MKSKEISEPGLKRISCCVWKVAMPAMHFLEQNSLAQDTETPNLSSVDLVSLSVDRGVGGKAPKNISVMSTRGQMSIPKRMELKLPMTQIVRCCRFDTQNKVMFRRFRYKIAISRQTCDHCFLDHDLVPIQ